MKKIVLFGSRARDNFRKDSDIDLAIYASDANVYEWQEVLDIIEDADTLLKIDCVRADALKYESLLRQNIEKEDVVVYERA